jgi:SP family xylose:H+ symportor-like MFS transporter
MYIAEVSPPEKRGRNVAINQLTVVIGILVTNLINYKLADYGVNAWRWMFGLGTIPAALFFVGVLWLPESPRWLIKAGRIDQARKVLNKIGNSYFVEQTFVVIGITLAVFQQLCGINVVFNYTSTIFEAVGANLDRQLFETVAIGIVNLLFTIIAMWQVDKLGRRPLMLIGSLGLSILYIILAFLLQSNAQANLVSVFVLLAIATYATSLAPVTWVLISEIFPNSIRGKASSVAIVALWSAYFVLVFTFPILAKWLGAFGPFYLYAVICLAGFFFVKSKVKETKGQTLEELETTLIGH